MLPPPLSSFPFSFVFRLSFAARPGNSSTRPYRPKACGRRGHDVPNSSENVPQGLSVNFHFPGHLGGSDLPGTVVDCSAKVSRGWFLVHWRWRFSKTAVTAVIWTSSAGCRRRVFDPDFAGMVDGVFCLPCCRLFCNCCSSTWP